ncbi:MAG: DUF2975 domain-containing protein [Ferruginibacter sp.]
MKTRTEKILVILKYVALLGGIGYCIECGGQLVSFVASFKNLEWAKQTYNVNQSWFYIREYSMSYYACTMSLLILLSGLKAFTWFKVVNLLTNLRITNPFSMEIAEKIERIGYTLLGVWVIGIIGKIYLEWLIKTTHIPITGPGIGDEYLFIAGIVYIISQIFKRGIEIQEENQLTV